MTNMKVSPSQNLLQGKVFSWLFNGRIGYSRFANKDQLICINTISFGKCGTEEVLWILEGEKKIVCYCITKGTLIDIKKDIDLEHSEMDGIQIHWDYKRELLRVLASPAITGNKIAHFAKVGEEFEKLGELSIMPQLKFMVQISENQLAVASKENALILFEIK